MRSVINVDGMSCEHCVKAVSDAVGALDGVSNVEVSLVDNTATVEYDEDEVSLGEICEAIEDQGYDILT
ncbi:MAG: copper chaperone CopZ [Lachnospiraceae bacterium]|jgi:copper chaperone|nr:copper chaperone CopZ [Lachnospiraceae bacterium]